MVEVQARPTPIIQNRDNEARPIQAIWTDDRTYLVRSREISASFSLDCLSAAAYHPQPTPTCNFGMRHSSLTTESVYQQADPEGPGSTCPPCEEAGAALSPGKSPDAWKRGSG